MESNPFAKRKGTRASKPAPVPQPEPIELPPSEYDPDEARRFEEFDRPVPEVWTDAGVFDTDRARLIFEQTKDWPAEQRAAMLRSLRAAEVRATVKTKYAHPGHLAAACDPTYTLTPALDLVGTAIEAVLNSPHKINLLITMPPQEGKLVELNTPVPTPDGWRKHGELGPGDRVFHPSGRVIEVTDRHPEAETQYRVHFSDHTSIEVHGAHEWTVYDRARGAWRTMETQAMARRKLRSGPVGRGGRYALQLPHREAVQLPDVKLLIDPYTLGVWLGNGSSSKPAVTHHPRDEYVLPYPRTARCVHPTTGIITDYYSGAGLWPGLRALGLVNNKHIPEVYLRGSIAQRRALLAGLIDTDGCITGAGTNQQVVFDNANEELVHGVAELARSLGYRAHVHAPTAPCTSTNGIVGKQWMWRVGFSPHDEAPARLPRKVANFRPATRRRVAVTRIEKLSLPGVGNCITVDSPDGLYCVGEGWTPTHNSTTGSVWTPLRALQLNPNRRIILATYADALAEMHSRTARGWIESHGTDVRDGLTGLMVPDRIGLKLAAGNSKVSHWGVEGGNGGLLAAGIGARMTGMPADLMIIDDPFKNAVEADSATHRAKVDTWFSTVALTRLAPDASVVLIQCMTGDTPVLRPDGTETPLADIRPGDEIATYEDGVISTSTVKNWASQGDDSIYAITTKSGRTVRANARHPFLVLREGVETWVKLSDLRPGDNLISTAVGTGSCVPLTAATPPFPAGGCACPTTTKCDGPRATSKSPKINAVTGTCDTDTASDSLITTACSPSRAGSAQAVASRPARTIAPLIGRASYASIIATKQGVCAACSAMIATSSSVAHEQPCGCVKVPTILTDAVVAIEACGTAEVFDIQVDRTENFIANGLVSHNTRWHPEDLAGKILAGEKLLDKSDRSWRHINIPAISEEGIKDALKRPPGTPMVSARDTPEAKRNFPMTRKQVGERTWYALYQGSPTNPAGGIFQRAWFDPRLPQPPDFPIASIVGVDPADSGEGDEAGIIAGSLYAEGGQAKIALTHDRSGHYTSDQWATIAVTLALEVGARVLAVEGYTTAKTYLRVVRQAYTALHNEAVAKRARGELLTPVEQRAVPDLPPFLIKPWRGPSKADAVARSGATSQSFEVGRARTVEFVMRVFEEQACDWNPGQHQPDRVAAAVIVHDELMELAGGQMTVASPVNRAPAAPPAWMRRKIG